MIFCVRIIDCCTEIIYAFEVKKMRYNPRLRSILLIGVLKKSPNQAKHLCVLLKKLLFLLC